MYFRTSAAVIALSAVLLPLAIARPFAGPPLPQSSGCTIAQKNAAVMAELQTISSHSFADAAKIPLAPGASRTFLVTPNELPEVTLTINVGFSGGTVVDELVLLATALDAGVPQSSIHLINNANGTVTSDFIQTDQIVLPYVHVREIHTFNSDCQIETIVGYVHGDLVCPVSTEGLDSVLVTLCTEAAAAGLLGTPQPATSGGSTTGLGGLTSGLI